MTALPDAPCRKVGGCRVLLAHRHLWPDAAPYGQILLRLAEQLARDGHGVVVQASLPGYRPGPTAPRHARRGRVHLHRCGHPWLGWAGNTALYCLALCWRILRERPAIVIVATTPPILPAWLAGLAADRVGAKLIYHVQDIHPEAAVTVGLWRRGGWLARLLIRLDRATLARAGAIVTLSDDMVASLRARGGPLGPIHCIENPALTVPATALCAAPADRADPVDPGWPKAPGHRRALFAGNLGRFQNLPLLAEGVALLFAQHPDLELCFLGDGAMAPALRARWAGHAQVRFLPQLPLASATALMQDCDVGLLALAPGMARLAAPAKLASYAALGLPVAALIEPETALARQIRARGWGAVAPAYSAAGVAMAVNQALQMGRSPPRHALTTTGLADWSRLVRTLCDDSGLPLDRRGQAR